jgi:hypothetical protein
VKSRQSWAELYAFEVDRAADAPVFRQIYLQFDRQSFQEGFVPRPSCRRRANSQRNSVFRGPRWYRLSNSFLQKALPSAGKVQGLTSRRIFAATTGTLDAFKAGIESIPGETGPLQLAKDGVKAAVNDVDGHFSSNGPWGGLTNLKTSLRTAKPAADASA